MSKPLGSVEHYSEVLSAFTSPIMVDEFRQAVEQRTYEACIRAMCAFCDCQHPEYFSEPERIAVRDWGHYNVEDGTYQKCEASPIHALRRGQG